MRRTYSEDAVRRGESRESDPIDRSLVENGRRVADPLRHVIGEIKEARCGLGDHPGGNYVSLLPAKARGETHPTRPFPNPLRKPDAPPLSAPWMGIIYNFRQSSRLRERGRTARPSNPETMDVTSDVAPAVTP